MSLPDGYWQYRIVSLLPHAEFGPNDYRKGAPHFTVYKRVSDDYLDWNRSETCLTLALTWRASLILPSVAISILPEYLASSLLETLTDWLQYIVSHVVAVKNRTHDIEHIYLSDSNNSKYSKVHGDLLVTKSQFLNE